MAFKVSSVSAIALLLSVASTVGAHFVVFDVTTYGARADEETDISQALSSAWKEACASPTPSRIVIPEGGYVLGAVKIVGPCQAPIELELQGTLRAPGKLEGDGWLTFNHIDQFTLFGGGTFDGQGQIAWSQNDCNRNTNCKKLAVNLRFNFVTNALVQDVTSLNSKNFHVNVFGCSNFTFQHFTITAPADSINTDGIHIGKSNGISITDSTIGTGDDCISLGDGSRQIYATNVRCGPGHGISVGSLGKYQNEEPVSGFFVKNCIFSNTDNGVRIKTWPALHGGLVSDMHFENIVMHNVSNPIIIDQMYCPWNQCNPKAPSKVKISDVSFKNIRGTSATPVAVQISCSSGVPCKRVKLADIHLAYNGLEGPAKSLCSNVKAAIIGELSPAGC